MNKFKHINRMHITIFIIIIVMIISMCIIDVTTHIRRKNIIMTIDDSRYTQITSDYNECEYDSESTDKSINQQDLDLLAALIHYEAGSDDCTDRHQQLVAQVVLNRVASDGFPDTIYDVITQTEPAVQYSPYENIVNNAGNRNIISQRCYDNALAVLNGEVECPPDIVWQANFKQGSDIYEVYETSYSITYFCHR